MTHDPSRRVQITKSTQESISVTMGEFAGANQTDSSLLVSHTVISEQRLKRIPGEICSENQEVFRDFNDSQEGGFRDTSHRVSECNLFSESML